MNLMLSVFHRFVSPLWAIPFLVALMPTAVAQPVKISGRLTAGGDVSSQSISPDSARSVSSQR